MVEASSWIDWQGGDNPLPHDHRVAVRFRAGNEFAGQAADFQWHHAVNRGPFDILAYLPIADDRMASELPTPPPAA